MKTVLSSSIVGVLVCVLLMLLNGSFGQTSRIEMGTSNFPAIYNETISIPAIHRPWYKRFFGWFTRTQAPIQNVTYTFPSPTPPSNQSMGTRCMISGVNVMDVDPYGNGGLAKVISGGLNHSNVTIRFTSQPGEAMIFHVVVTGYCLKNYTPSQSYGWAEPLRSYSPYHYNNSDLYNNSANYKSIATSNSIPPSKPWWHFW